MSKIYVDEILPKDAASISMDGSGIDLSNTTMPSGTTVQTQANNLTGRYSQSCSGLVWTALTDFNISITPKYDNSKFLISVRWNGELGAYNYVYNSVFGLSRNGTAIGNQPDPSGTTVSGIAVPTLSYEGSDSSSTQESMNLFWMDEPNVAAGTTITYAVRFMPEVTLSLYTNRTVNWAGQTAGHELTTSGIIVQEIKS